MTRPAISRAVNITLKHLVFTPAARRVEGVFNKRAQDDEGDVIERDETYSSESDAVITAAEALAEALIAERAATKKTAPARLETAAKPVAEVAEGTPLVEGVAR